MDYVSILLEGLCTHFSALLSLVLVSKKMRIIIRIMMYVYIIIVIRRCVCIVMIIELIN